MKTKKIRFLAALLAAVMCFSLLAGCSDKDAAVGGAAEAPDSDGAEKSGTNEKSAPGGGGVAADEPVPNNPEGYYTGALRISFDGEAQDDGKLFILLDRDETPDDVFYLENEQSNRDAGLVIGEYPSEHSFYIDIYTPGVHTLSAFSVNGDGECSEVYIGTYEIDGADFSDFSFNEPGSYSSPLSLSFNGTDGGAVYYTLDNTDPLFLSVGGANLSQGTKLEEDTLVLLPGIHNVTARCITDSGLVSPMIQGTFNVPLAFDSASTQVEEDSVYEYICDGWGPLLRYDKATGDYENIFDKKVTHVAVYEVTAQPKIDEENKSTLLPEYIIQSENKKITKTYIYARVADGRVYRGSSVEGEVGGWEEVSGADIIQRIGTGWYRRTTLKDPNYGYRNHAFWNHTENQQGTEEMAEKADLMLNGVALYCNNTYYIEEEHHGRRVYMCDYDGGNEQILWSDEDIHPILDAVTGNKLLYHYQSKEGDVHMVYDLETAEHYANPFVNTGDIVSGYTSSAAYVNGGRIEIDYSEL